MSLNGCKDAFGKALRVINSVGLKWALTTRDFHRCSRIGHPFFFVSQSVISLVTHLDPNSTLRIWTALTRRRRRGGG